MTAYEIAFLLCVLCVAGGVAGVVGCLIERFIVMPIVRRQTAHGLLTTHNAKVRDAERSDVSLAENNVSGWNALLA